MFNVGGGEFLVIALVALLVLGPQRLPVVARKLGSFVGDVKRMSDSFQDEMHRAMEIPEEPVVKPRSDGGPTDLTAADADAPPIQRAVQSGGSETAEVDPGESEMAESNSAEPLDGAGE